MILLDARDEAIFLGVVKFTPAEYKRQNGVKTQFLIPSRTAVERRLLYTRVGGSTAELRFLNLSPH